MHVNAAEASLESSRCESWDDRWPQTVVRLGDYPQLRDLAWNRVDDFIRGKEAFQLYERNWRLLDLALLDGRERELIARLKAEFGNDDIIA